MHFHLRLSLIVLALMLPSLFQADEPTAPQTWGPGLTYSDFSEIPRLNLIEDAQQLDNKIRLTPAVAWQTGGVWYSDKIYVEGGFRTTFQFQITEQGGTQPEPGADGIVFVVQNDTNTTYGASGEGLGYQGIPNSLAVEYDTWDDYWLNEPNNNHISVHTRGTQPNSHDPAYSIGYTTDIPNLSDGALHTTTVEYVPGQLSVYLDNQLAPVLTVDLDLAQTLALDQGRAWVGFTSATGAAWENHDLLNWTLDHAPNPNSDGQPAFDLPFAYDNFAAALQESGRVNAWFDHTSPELSEDSSDNMTRWDGCVGAHYKYNGHNGTDFSALTSNEEVFAVAPGIVYRIHDGCEPGVTDCGPGYGGNQVFIDHLNGYVTRYAHLDEVSVAISQTITITNLRTIPLGTMGTTGNSTGVHLHFAVYHDPPGGRPSTSGFDQQVDPFGYLPIHCDDGPATEPWNGEDRYLWRESLYTGATLGEHLVAASSASGRIQVVVPAAAVSSPTQMELWEAPAVDVPAPALRPLGRSFTLRLSQNVAQAVPSERLLLTAFQEPVTLTIAYNPESTKHLVTEQLALYRWDEEQAQWSPLATSVDTIRHRVIAETDQLGSYDVQAPLLCSLDLQEPNDSFSTATLLSPGTRSLQQRFDVRGDEDWYTLEVSADLRYRLNIENLAPAVASVIELYEADGDTLLASADSGADNSATIVWQPLHDGLYYLRIFQPSAADFGCDLAYELTVQPEQLLFMPVLMQPTYR